MDYGKIPVVKDVRKLYHRWLAYQLLQKRLAQRREVVRTYDRNIFYLNIGSGIFVRKNWRLMDLCTGGYYDKNIVDYDVNLVYKPVFPIADETVDLVYTGHCMEHIGDEAVQHVFNEVYRILKRGGVFRVVVPDASLADDAYRKGDLAWFQHLYRKNHEFEGMTLEQYYRHYVGRPMDLEDPHHDFSQHVSSFNREKIHTMVRLAGFTDIRPSLPHGSISEEMSGPDFDSHEELSLCTDMVK